MQVLLLKNKNDGRHKKCLPSFQRVDKVGTLRRTKEKECRFYKNASVGIPAYGRARFCKKQKNIKETLLWQGFLHK